MQFAVCRQDLPLRVCKVLGTFTCTEPLWLPAASEPPECSQTRISIRGFMNSIWKHSPAMCRVQMPPEAPHPHPTSLCSPHQSTRRVYCCNTISCTVVPPSGSAVFFPKRIISNFGVFVVNFPVLPLSASLIGPLLKDHITAHAPPPPFFYHSILSN